MQKLNKLHKLRKRLCTVASPKEIKRKKCIYIYITELSKFIWSCKDSGINPVISWKRVCHATPYQHGAKYTTSV